MAFIKTNQLVATYWVGGTIDVWGKKNEKGTSGPMVGHVTSNEAIIWAWGGKNPKFRIRYRKMGDTLYLDPVDMNPQKGVYEKNYRSVSGKLSNLKPDTVYEYICYLEGDSSKFEKKGEFKTAPLEVNVPASFKVAISSCMRRRDDKIQYALKGILEQKPDLQFIIGDSVYYDDQADKKDPPRKDGIFDKENMYATKRNGKWTQWQERYGNKNKWVKQSWYWDEWFWSYHIRQRAIPSFADNLRNIPTYSTWDDHDYAFDNDNDLRLRDQFFDTDADGNDKAADNDQIHAVSTQVFRGVWRNPENNDKDYKTTDGVYYNFKRGKEVEFFVLDGRTNLDASKKQMFGEKQLNWLCKKLNASEAKFKIIISGSTVTRWAEFHNKKTDVTKVNNDKEKIKNILTGKYPNEATGTGKVIKGVIFVTGDIHECDLVKHTDFGVGYDIYEVISSGIATPFHYEWGKDESYEDGEYVVRDEAFAFATLSFKPGKVLIRFHRQRDAYQKYRGWLDDLSDEELNNSVLLGQLGSNRLEDLKNLRENWRKMSMSTSTKSGQPVFDADDLDDDWSGNKGLVIMAS